jgi:hypothetical protein
VRIGAKMAEATEAAKNLFGIGTALFLAAITLYAGSVTAYKLMHGDEEFVQWGILAAGSVIGTVAVSSSDKITEIAVIAAIPIIIGIFILWNYVAKQHSPRNLPAPHPAPRRNPAPYPSSNPMPNPVPPAPNSCPMPNPRPSSSRPNRMPTQRNLASLGNAPTKPGAAAYTTDTTEKGKAAYTMDNENKGKATYTMDRENEYTTKDY